MTEAKPIEEGPADEALRSEYAERCHIFAMALSARTGLPILEVGTSTPGGERIGHVCVEVSDDIVADLDGAWLKADMLRMWGCDFYRRTSHRQLEDALAEGAADDHEARASIADQVYAAGRAIILDEGKFADRIRVLSYTRPSQRVS